MMRIRGPGEAHEPCVKTGAPQNSRLIQEAWETGYRPSSHSTYVLINPALSVATSESSHPACPSIQLSREATVKTEWLYFHFRRKKPVKFKSWNHISTCVQNGTPGSKIYWCLRTLLVYQSGTHCTAKSAAKTDKPHAWNLLTTCMLYTYNSECISMGTPYKNYNNMPSLADMKNELRHRNCRHA